MEQVRVETSTLSHEPRRTMALVLAGGRGRRMHSQVPKSLHEVAGKPILEHILLSLVRAQVPYLSAIIGAHHHEAFRGLITAYPEMEVCLQDAPLGTAHAVGCAGHLLDDVTPPLYSSAGAVLKRSSVRDSPITSLLICPGDAPALCAQTLSCLMAEHERAGAHLSMIAMHMDQPFGYGRILRSSAGAVQGIVEEIEASEAQRQITLCYAGIMLVDVRSLFAWLGQVRRREKSGEYYLTDIVAHAFKDGAKIHLHTTRAWQCFMGINTARQRALVDDYMLSHASA